MNTNENLRNLIVSSTRDTHAMDQANSKILIQMVLFCCTKCSFFGITLYLGRSSMTVKDVRYLPLWGRELRHQQHSQAILVEKLRLQRESNTAMPSTAKDNPEVNNDRALSVLVLSCPFQYC
jgi:hypothetical protein